MQRRADVDPNSFRSRRNLRDYILFVLDHPECLFVMFIFPGISVIIFLIRVRANDWRSLDNGRGKVSCCEVFCVKMKKTCWKLFPESNICIENVSTCIIGSLIIFLNRRWDRESFVRRDRVLHSNPPSPGPAHQLFQDAHCTALFWRSVSAHPICQMRARVYDIEVLYNISMGRP